MALFSSNRLRRAAQSDPAPRSTVGAVGSMARLSVIAGVGVAAMAIPASAFVAVTVNDVSSDIIDMPLTLEDRPNAQTSVIQASDGRRLAYFYSENRQDVPLAKIAPVMQKALISIEDARFYEHGPLDLKGTLRALVNNAASGSTQGGSTLTQQLVKQTLVSQATTDEERMAAIEKSTARKIRELKLAVQYEEAHSKDEILERYLNIAYFGDGAYGINSAAYHFFSTSPEKLNARQAATLAGLVQNPDEYNPTAFPENALQRRNTVLAVMAREDVITAKRAEEIQAEPLRLKITKFPNGCVESTAAFSCDYIRQYLLQDKSLGETEDDRRQLLLSGGLTIKSTIDVGMQKAANDAVTSTVAPTDKALGLIAMVEPGTGKVRGVAQSRPMGRDKKKGQSYINFTVPTRYGQSGGFSAGSTFKMFTAAAALKKGLGPGTSFNSPANMVMPPGSYFDCQGGGTSEWTVKNSTTSGGKNMYTGLSESVNTYFSQLEKAAGLCNTVRMAQAMGITVPSRDVVGPFTLGVTSVSPLDMAAAYATVASGGMYCKPQPVDSIVDRAGKVIKKYEPECKRVLSTEQAAQINDILRIVQERGFGFQSGTGLNIPSAAKTGTAEDNVAVSYAGYTPELSTFSMIAGVKPNGGPRSLAGVTINGRPLDFASVGGASLAGPMWKKAMGVIQNQLAPVNFDTPPERQPVARRPTTNNDTRGNDDARGGNDRNGGGGNRGRGNGGDDE